MDNQADSATGDKASSAGEEPSSPLVIDLSQQPSETASSSDITEPTLEPPGREKTRTLLAFAVVLTLPGLVVLVFATLMLHLAPAADIKEVGTFLLTPLVGIAGAVLGFYFGERRR